jgi:hypothetical protein
MQSGTCVITSTVACGRRASRQPNSSERAVCAAKDGEIARLRAESAEQTAAAEEAAAMRRQIAEAQAKLGNRTPSEDVAALHQNLKARA